MHLHKVNVVTAKKAKNKKCVCTKEIEKKRFRPAIDGHKHSNIQTSKHSNIDECWVKLDFYLEFS
jgi:hypothetical protein